MPPTAVLSSSAARLVLDTNTVMALWHFGDRTLTPLRDAIAKKSVMLLSRDDALEEFRLVLAYRQFAIPAQRQSALFNHYRRLCSSVPYGGAGTPALPNCRDRDDQKFLEIARDGHAVDLLSRDKALLKLSRHRLIRPLYRILSPEAWCKESSPPACPPVHQAGIR